MKTNLLARAALATLTLCASVILPGCGGAEAVGIARAGGGILGALAGNGGLFGGRQGGGFYPQSPGGGSGSVYPTTNLGSLGGGIHTNRNPSPGLLPRGPSSPITFDSDQQRVLAEYNASIEGYSATPERVQRVLAAIQLYKRRSHPITIYLQEDPSKLPVSAMWTGMGNSAQIEVWQPDLQHTINHEFAHDLTLMVDPDSGRRLEYEITSRQGDPGTFPSNYSQTNETEAKAEIVSFLAAIYTGMPIDEQPWNSFNPARPIQDAAKAFYSDRVLQAIRN